MLKQTLIDEDNLQCVVDNRSGDRLELVFMTLNEAERLKHICKYYGDIFDLVILDGGSTDGTGKIVTEHNGTVFLRQSDNVGENHFVSYVNNQSVSGRCFYLMCDEYVSIETLLTVDEHLKTANSHVIANRIDYFYGKRASKASCQLPKGFIAGTALYNASDFHNTLFCSLPCPEILSVDVMHFHIHSIDSDYGKYGHYISHEVREICSNKNYSIALFLRLLKLIRSLQLNSWRFRRYPGIVFFLFLQFWAGFFIFSMTFLEHKLLRSKADQLNDFKNLFGDAGE